MKQNQQRESIADQHPEYMARITTQCVDPETGKTGCWLFLGTNHRTPGTSASPVFDDSYELYQWMQVNGWNMIGYDLAFHSDRAQANRKREEQFQ